MVESPKTGRELTTEVGYKGPEWARRFFALFGIRGVEDADEDDR